MKNLWPGMNMKIFSHWDLPPSNGNSLFYDTRHNESNVRIFLLLIIVIREVRLCTSTTKRFSHLQLRGLRDCQSDLVSKLSALSVAP